MSSPRTSSAVRPTWSRSFARSRIGCAAHTLVLVALLGACGRAPPDLSLRGAEEVEAELAACPVDSAAGPLRIDTVAAGLEVPWDVAFLPDGGALVTERAGRIRLVDSEGGLRPETWATLDVYEGDEVGLMGIDVTSTSSSEAAAYVSLTRRENPSGLLASLAARVRRRVVRAVDPERGHPVTLEVARLPIRGGEAGPLETVVEGIPAFPLHGGGALRFGPDGFLYLSNGDGFAPEVAQSPRSLRGKILRYEADGSVPDGNPQADSPVWALGVRHSQGLAWSPDGRRMYAIDHGPSGLDSEGGRTDRDELNVVAAGANLGWPVVTGLTRGGPFTSAIVGWTPALAPAGLAAWDAADPSHPWAGSLFVTGLRGTSLRRVEVQSDEDGGSATCGETVLGGDHGRLRLVRQAPDGTLWVGTSNRDGRGLPREGGDHILRVHPPQP